MEKGKIITANKGDSSINGLSPSHFYRLFDGKWVVELDELTDDNPWYLLVEVFSEEQSDPKVSSAIDEQIEKLRDRGII